MKLLRLTFGLALALVLPRLSLAQQPDANAPARLLTGAVTRVTQMADECSP